MNTIKGRIKPLGDKIFVCDMNFSERVTSSGIVIQADDGKLEGIKPRWAKVWAIGPKQIDVAVSDWILIEHGRWSRGFEVEDNTNVITVRTVDNNAILLISDKKPKDV